MTENENVTESTEEGTILDDEISSDEGNAAEGQTGSEEAEVDAAAHGDSDEPEDHGEVSEEDATKLLDRFKTEEGVLDEHKLAKSYINMRKSRDKATAGATLSDEQRDTAIETGFQEHNMQWRSDEERDHWTNWIQENEFNEKQIGAVLAAHAQIQNQIIEEYGLPVDAKAEEEAEIKRAQQEVMKLKGDLGPEKFKDVAPKVNAYIKQLPADLRFLGDSAAGIQAAIVLMESDRGPQIIRDANTSPVDVADLQKQLDDLVADPTYGSSPALQAKAQKLGAQLAGRQDL